MRSSHSTRDVVELLLPQGGPHAAAFALGFSGERDTPLRINELDLPWVGMEDDDPRHGLAQHFRLCHHTLESKSFNLE